MRIERLFVPLKVVAESDPPKEVGLTAKEKKETITPVGEFLCTHSRFSLLAKPGGGKSTLLKRLGVAYAMPERRIESDDGLPDRHWLPLFLRCRELRDRAHRPLRELLWDLSKHAGMKDDETALFQNQIDDALRRAGDLAS